MTNYWFLYDTATGNIQGSPYLGLATTWTNVPTGQATLGPFDASTAAATIVDAYQNPTYYTVSNGVFVQKSNIAALQLTDAQNAQLTVIDGDFSNSIGKFTSSALGSGHTYTYLDDSMSMAFLSAQYSYVRSSDYKGENINWYTVESGKVAHTGAQIAQVFLDGHAWVRNQEAHKDRLESQIKAATTVSQAQSITWTTPPNVPTGLAGTAGTGQASLTWTANTEGDLAGYNVYQNGVKVNASLLTTASDTINGLTSGTTYSFTVTAVDVNGNESAQCTAVSVKAN